ncbi:MAG: Lrp/AsnC ligand binding domain-containing protein [Natronomonas sp.]|jgi:DNA-binding Lrp family transcriptional regulator|uniref:Lrp/AsnC family transcriptional regulator n=1 Tax=Natronomonas sp. TaxID=2184060 RepID=UPI00286FED71|nr:Lrp/AsnC ligand binding domain-containing protein [Natronomonas sp.]MDR9382245.1 Lrp/AsnC ligand binding domain-containing protein [Natronomonas sp.]MDR9430101.1 Lrp/AsnC ligand binding domain-containing protein [Natronomonas sp.]
MVVAYVMVKAHTGEAGRLRDDIAAIDGVVSAHIVAGDIDIITKVDVESPADVKDIAADAIQALDGVEDTHTYIAMG